MTSNPASHSLELYKTIFENSPDAILITLPSYKVLDANHAFKEMLGYSKSDVVDNNLIDIFPELSPVLKELESLKVPRETFIPSKNGEKVFCQLSLLNLKEDGSQVVVIFIRDLRTGQEEEIILQESEERYHSLFNNMLNGFAYCKMIFKDDKPVDFIYLDVNKAFESLTGLKNVTGKYVSEVIPGIRESDPELFEIYTRVALTGQAEVFEIFLESLQEWFSVSVYSPRREYFVAIFNVITSQKESEEMLKKSLERETFFGDIIRNASLAIAVGYPDGKIGDVNKAFEDLTGYSQDELKSVEWNHELTPERWRKIEQRHLEEVLKTRESVTYEKEYMKKDGSMVPVELVVQPHFNQKGDLEYYFAFINDLTERKKAEEQLKKSEIKYRNALENMMEGCQIISPQWKYLYLNEAAVKHSRFPREKLINHTMMEIYPGIEDTDMFKTLQKSMKERIPSRLTNEFVFPDGKKQWFELSAHPVPEGLFILSMDITERKNVENKLKKSEEKYRMLYSSMAEGMAFHKLIYNNQGQAVDYEILDVNPSFEALLNIKKEDVVGKKASQIYGTGEAPYLDIYAEVAETGQPEKFETHFETMHMYFSISVFSPSKGFFATIFKDISENKNFEKKLKKSEERFRTVADFTYDWEYWLDPKGNLLYVSPSCQRISGYSPQEFLDDPQLLLKITNPQDKKILEEHKHLRSARKNVEEIEFRIITKKGKERWIDHRCQPIYNDQDEYLGIRATNRDITESKMTEAKLKESESRYRGLFDKSSSYLFLVSAQGTIIDVNEITVDFTGKTKEELMGKHISEMGILPPEEIPVQMEKASQALQGKKIKPFESILIDKDGQKHYVMVNSNTLKKDDEIFAFQIICNDITNLKLAEKEIMKSLQEKELLLQEIHHRVKNNMQIISSLLNLQSYQVQEEETRDILKDSQGRIKAMSMVHEKLYQSPDLSHINVKEYVEKLVQDLFYSYEVKGHIDFHLEIEEVEMNMETVIPLGLIINELINNSLKFAFPDGEGSLGVSLKSKDHEYTLMVYDNGIGIDETLNIHKPGTLGLKLVQSLVDQLDAEMELDGSGGTRFIIRFQQVEYKERI